MASMLRTTEVIPNAVDAARQVAPSDPSLEEKVAFLSDPAGYPGRVRRVQTAETHMSWVFLTVNHAYKLKKPAFLDHHDLRTVAARRAHCRMEIALNRRLTEGVYLGAVSLTVGDDGLLRLDLGGHVVDWLVWMRRLPAARMLDALVARGRATPEDVRSLMDVLGRFYRDCPPEPIRPPEFRARFAMRIAQHVRDLCADGAGLPTSLVEELGEQQLAFLDTHAELFDRRVTEGRIVEGHGDLRPEHVCLEEPRAQVIDCLEFDRELRVLDVAEELGFLALECERLGGPQLRQWIFDAYADFSGDLPDPRLVDFYQSHHACVRAMLAVWHLREPRGNGHRKWINRAKKYLALARSHASAFQA
jgi:aminoglycoside phosphotransferase family enzyme